MTFYHLAEQRHGIIGSVPWHARKRADIEGFCREHPEWVLVAEEDGQVVGYATFSYSEADRAGTVGNNAVHPAFRGRGTGSALVRAAIEQLTALGARVLQVVTMEQDAPARHIYERCGFQEIARSIYYTMESGGAAGVLPAAAPEAQSERR